MADMNSCSFTGRLTRDALFKDVASGLCEFSIAINGIKPEDVIYMKVNLWGKTAHAIHSYLTKGKLVGVSGSLKKNEWKDREGEIHKDMILNSNALTFLGGGDDKQKYENEKPPYDQDEIPF